jgi:hypothetical protein
MNRQSLPIAVGSAVAVLAGAVPAAAGSRPALTVAPAIVDRGAAAAVIVSGLDAASVDVRVVGAKRWRPLVLRAGRWSGAVRGPLLRGVYALELRSHGRVYRSHEWLLRVLGRRTLSRPSFATPEAVAAWWARTVPQRRSRLVAIRPWPLPADDRRDPQLHRLFVIAYGPVGDRNPSHRLGIWITAFRNQYGGSWRLLEATVQPPGPTRRSEQHSKPMA